MIEQMIEEMKDYQLYAIKNAIMGIDVAKHCIEIAEKYKADKCKWTLIDEESNVYDTDYRKPHILMNDEYKYCPYCGKEIEIYD